ncbi:MAG TPA: hypothetical protein DEF51_30520 [Myxococcales bacterium]|jgi:restriction endonuclease Mrr|nr:hypothetical protein [Myxococcales bacterium]
MTAPNFRDHRIYMVPLLRVLARRGPSSPASIYDDVADLAGIPNEQRVVGNPKDRGNPVYRNRIQFARQSLIDAGLMFGSSDSEWQRGLWQLNRSGEELARTGNLTQMAEKLRALAAEGARNRAAASSPLTNRPQAD